MVHILTWEADPGHAWLQVGWSLIEELGWNNVSKYSYHDDEYVYLEEDSDAPKFLNFLESKGIGVWFEERYNNSPSFVRNLTQW